MRIHFSLISLVAVALAVALSPAVAFAHARIVASNPAEGATVAKPRTLSITFSDAMLAPTVAASVVMIAMPGMADHPPMTIRNFQSAWSKDNRTITLTLRQPLVAGAYELRWQAAGTDSHRMTGKVSFAVR